MTKANCFPVESLKEYLSGELDESESSRIELHLAECVDCEQTIVDLEKEPDTIVELLRSSSTTAAEAGSDDPQTPSVIVRAVENAKELMDDEVQPRLARWTPPPGDFGAYELIKPLGRGGMAAVYLARHRQLGKLVAIKMLPAPVEFEQESAARFQREIRAAGSLNHPAIVLATDAGEHDGLQYLVMEYIDGLDLSRLARTQGPLEIADACELARQVALGLSHAHAAGIVHRDIKPSNLMLDASGRAKILDFGLAQLSLWDEASAELTTVGQLMGTLDYMAPEQAERSGAVDYRADLYALGATLFRLLCGRAPLAATPNLSPLEKLRMLASHEPPKLNTLRPDAPQELVVLVSSLLARVPESRPASAAHVVEQLAPFAADSDLSGLLERAKSALQSPDKSVKRIAVMPQPLVASSLVPSDRHPPRHRLRKWLIAAAFLPLLAFAGVLIVLETQKGQLVIESEVADVQVKILQDGQTNREFTLQPGATTTRLYAGQYEVTLASPSDSITLENDRFNIRKGETVVARVQHKPIAAKSDTVSTIPSAAISSSSELMYDGKPLSGWLDQLERDRSPEAIEQSFAAIRALAGPETSKQITDTLVSVLPKLDGSARLHPNNLPGAPIDRTRINEEAFSILQKCHPNERFAELLIRLLDSKEFKLKVLVLTPATFSSYSSAEPVLNWLEKHFSSAGIKSPESDEVQAVAVHCLKASAQPNTASNADSGKLAAYALRLLKQWDFVGQDFWLMEPFPKRLDDWYIDYRQEVIRRAVEAIIDINTSPQSVAEATVILSSMPAYGLYEVNNELRKSLVSAIEARITNLSKDANRLLGLTNLPVYFGEYRQRIAPIQLRTMEVKFLNRDPVPPGKPAVSEIFELLEFCKVLIDDDGAYQLNVEPVKRLLTATESQFSRVRSRFEPFRRGQERAQVSWPSLRILAVNETDKNDAVFAQALKLTPQDWMGFFIHIKAANLVGIALEEPQPEQASNRLLTSSATSPAEPQQRSSNAKRTLEPTFEGKPLSEWLDVLKIDRSPATLNHALQAVAALVADENAPEVTKTILGILHSKESRVWQDSGVPILLDSVALQVLAKANPGDKFGGLLVQDLEANEDQLTRRLLGALTTATVRDQLTPILEWLASSPIPLGYSDDVVQSLDAFLKKILVSSRELRDSKKRAFDIAIRLPSLGKVFLFRVFISEVYVKDPAPAWHPDFQSAVGSLAKAIIGDENASAIDVAMASMALVYYANLDADSEDLEEPIQERLRWFKNNPERLLSTVDKRSRPLVEGGSDEQFGQLIVRFPRTLFRPYADAEFLSLFDLLKRLKLTELFTDELVEIQKLVAPGYEEALRVLPPGRVPSSPVLTWPFGEQEVAQLPEAYRGVPQKSWIAYVIHEQISKTIAAMEAQRKNDEERKSASKGRAASANPLYPGEIERAKGHMKKYDKNGDGVLTADEWSSMIIKPTGADSNGDGIITPEEYAIRLRKR